MKLKVHVKLFLFLSSIVTIRLFASRIRITSKNIFANVISNSVEMFIFILRYRHPLNILKVKSILYTLFLINLDRFCQDEVTRFISC